MGLVLGVDSRVPSSAEDSYIEEPMGICKRNSLAGDVLQCATENPDQFWQKRA
jgi:hypothetical protein